MVLKLCLLLFYSNLLLLTEQGFPLILFYYYWLVKLFVIDRAFLDFIFWEVGIPSHSLLFIVKYGSQK